MTICPEARSVAAPGRRATKRRWMHGIFSGLAMLLSAQLFAEPGIPLAQRLVDAARAQIGVTVGYDGSYRRLDYPNGDVPIETGVCTDVVIRALRSIGIDLQRQVHEDRRRHPERYAGRDRLIDRSIDHRRVPNLKIWFTHHAEVLTASTDVKDYRPGDIVSWKLPGGLDHIGIVSDHRIAARPLVLHNISRGTREEDVLFAWTITGHYRLR
jgi:uncharacterized protein